MSKEAVHYRCSICGLGGEIVLENDRSLFLQAPHQVLVGSGIIVPREHKPTLFDLDDAEWAATYSLLLSCPRIFWTPICPTGGIHDEVEHDPNRNHRCE